MQQHFWWVLVIVRAKKRKNKRETANSKMQNPGINLLSPLFFFQKPLFSLTFYFSLQLLQLVILCVITWYSFSHTEPKIKNLIGTFLLICTTTFAVVLIKHLLHVLVIFLTYFYTHFLFAKKLNAKIKLINGSIFITF